MTSAANRMHGLNRHRGLRIGQLGSRYLRLRDLARTDGYGDCGAHIDCACDGDGDWDCEDPRIDPGTLLHAWREGVLLAARRPRMSERVPAALRSLRLPDQQTDQQTPAGAGSPPARSAPAELGPRFCGKELPEALYEHIAFIQSKLDQLDFIHSARCQRAIAELADGLGGRIDAFPWFAAHPGAIGMALLFGRFWIRPLWSWSPPAACATGSGEAAGAAMVASLIGHLFVRYPVPAFLYRTWISDELPAFKWVCWTLLLGQGGSLLAGARRFGWVLSRGFAARLLEVPADLDAVDACMWAEIAHLGGGQVELDRLRANPAFRIDPTEPPPTDRYWRLQPDLSRFWRETVAWLIRHRDQVTEEECQELLAWGLHLHTEGVGFSWQGRTPRASLEAARAPTRQVPWDYARLSWKGRGWDWAWPPPEPPVEGARPTPTWTMTELTSGLALQEEGAALRHCVAGYAHACATGRVAIFSLRCAGERRLTVEIDVASRAILQARGTCNRAARPEEDAVLRRWRLTLRG